MKPILIDGWLSASTIADPDARTPLAALAASWHVWQLQRRQVPSSRLAFARTLEARGFVRYSNSYSRGFLGLALRSEPGAVSQVDRLLTARESVA